MRIRNILPFRKGDGEEKKNRHKDAAMRFEVALERDFRGSLILTQENTSSCEIGEAIRKRKSRVAQSRRDLFDALKSFGVTPTDLKSQVEDAAQNPQVFLRRWSRIFASKKVVTLADVKNGIDIFPRVLKAVGSLYAIDLEEELLIDDAMSLVVEFIFFEK